MLMHGIMTHKEVVAEPATGDLTGQIYHTRVLLTRIMVHIVDEPATGDFIGRFYHTTMVHVYRRLEYITRVRMAT